MINLCDGNLQKRVLTGLLAWFRLDSMEIIVLTGGIGSGKSVVAGMLKELGAGIIDS
ncbi:MAG: Dephospho-CoA kinase, partial [Chloroflexi bacterium]|nr:Dephospho-CoA kinase [Chloroflexota bacterium]